MSASDLPSVQSTSSVPAKREFPRINAFFDALELVIERTEGLVWKVKYLLFGIGFLLFVIYELAHFAKFLVHNWKGG